MEERRWRGGEEGRGGEVGRKREEEGWGWRVRRGGVGDLGEKNGGKGRESMDGFIWREKGKVG